MTYGCHNRKEFKDVEVVSDGRRVECLDDGHTFVALELIRTSAFRMSRDCEYTKTDLGQADAGCVGCKWRLNQ